MPSPLAGPLANVALHPLTEHSVLPITPVLAASVAIAIVVAVAVLWPASRKRAVRAGREPLQSWEGSLSLGQTVTRVLAIFVLLLAIAAGRFGSDQQLENIAPALVVGAAWPLLVLGSALLGPIWRWIDPWDGIARLLSPNESRGRERSAPGNGRSGVHLALVPALAWGWYLSVYIDALSPRSVGTALGLYTIVTLAGCLAMGRVWWLSRVELFGLLFGWTARFPRGRLTGWSPPPGTELILGALAGGLLFGAVRQSELWGELNVVPGATLYATIGLLLSAGGMAALLWALRRLAASRGAAGSVAAAVVPALAGLAVAFGLARNRLFTSLQLLPTLAADPFGRGWSLFGESTFGVNLNPLGDRGRVATQLALLLTGSVIGAVVLARRSVVRGRVPGLAGLLAVLAGGVLAVTASA
ncbi:MAG: hypothetical protein H0W27_03565 [Actinobacteria bacterium]|nr:hypothetical protein [Actinomycetota bacterium]